MQRISKSKKAGLAFPVARVKSMLYVHQFGRRISDTSAVFLTSMLEYVTTEILELSLNVARSEGLKRIQPRHVNIALKSDPDFGPNFWKCTIPKCEVYRPTGDTGSPNSKRSKTSGDQRETKEKSGSKTPRVLYKSKYTRKKSSRRSG